MTEQIVKNQHYIPQSLLIHFADPDEKLFEVFLHHDKKVFPTNVSNTMCETYTYEHDKLPINTIENYFSRIEGEVSPAMKICKAYPKIVFEDKKYSFALGYRLVEKKQN